MGPWKGSGRFQRRFGCCCCRRYGGICTGFRYGGLNKAACFFLRHRRYETHLWCGFAFWFGGFCIFHGPDWSVDQGCNGLRHGTECHNRLRPDGFHFCRRKVSWLFKSFDYDVKGIRIGIPKEYIGDNTNLDVKKAVLDAAKTLKSLGRRWRSVHSLWPNMPFPLIIISSAEASSNLARYDGIKYGYRAKEYTDLMDLYVRTRSEGSVSR